MMTKTAYYMQMAQEAAAPDHWQQRTVDSVSDHIRAAL